MNETAFLLTRPVGLIVAIVLVAIAALHLLWAARIWWPIRQEALLAKASAGFAGIDRMPPPLACAFVAISLVAITWLTAAASGLTGLAPPVSVLLLAIGGSALVFLGRGMLGYTALWRRITPEQPFRRLDSLYFSPLCIALGCGLLFIAADLYARFAS